MTLTEELSKFYHSGHAMLVGPAEFFQNLGHMVNSLVAVIIGFIAHVDWANTPHALVNANAIFQQKFSKETKYSPVHDWIRALPYRAINRGAYYSRTSSVGEFVSCTPAFSAPPFVHAIADYTPEILINMGVISKPGGPWLKTQHGVTSLERLFELLHVRLPCGSAYRRHAGASVLANNRIEAMGIILEAVHSGGFTPIPTVTGSGFAYDSKHIWYEDFGAIENVLVSVLIELMMHRSGPTIYSEVPRTFRRVGKYKFWECCTNHASSFDRKVSQVKPDLFLEAAYPWLKVSLDFYTPGYYNTRSVGYVLATDGSFEIMLAKNIYSIVNIGLATLEHGSHPDLKLPLSTYVAISKKRDWGEHFTSWLGILDRNVRLQYFQGANQNAFLAKTGTSLSVIDRIQNDTFMWTGPENESDLYHGCSRKHHLNTKQKTCNVCSFSESDYKILSPQELIKQSWWVPQSAIVAPMSMLLPDDRGAPNIPLRHWLRLCVFSKLSMEGGPLIDPPSKVDQYLAQPLPFQVEGGRFAICD